METEAYFGPAARNPHLAQRDDMPARLRAALVRRGDPASHSFAGITDRNRIMYGPPGYWYVYLIYGMHECVNVTTGPEDKPEPQAVLLRAGEPVEGIGEMVARRGLALGARETDIASGPAKLAKAMGITRGHYGLDAAKPTEALRFEEGVPPRRVVTTPRIGVIGGEALALRYCDADSAHVSKRRRTAKAPRSPTRDGAPRPARRR